MELVMINIILGLLLDWSVSNVWYIPNPLFIHPLTNLSEDCVGAMACYVRMLLKEVLV